MPKKRQLKIAVIASAFLMFTIAAALYFLTGNAAPLTTTLLMTETARNSVPKPPSLSESATSAGQAQTAPPTNTVPRPLPIHTSDSRALELYKQGLELYYQRRFPQALALFNQALTIDPQCYEALNGKGATLAFQGSYDQGLALIQQALEINPDYVYGNFNRGLAYELAGRWDDAIAAYQKALQLDKRDTWSYYGIASIYGRLGNIDKVLEYLQPAITLDPDVKEVAREEKDFAPVRENPRFQALIKP
ncbi:tetratricopeptide repeat protein [Desulfosporosinus sp. PR]|uniref:tetratricopeptide repeat protein n=1 Tax=Candidatus Desulfosporosinus nitrosoreducens TaxID=3401928 RepID=UPI0027F73164|nr:tetratricopeptide repeat protein [Desulfosporosinus sp. PR]MDQ7096014.1 tetratricopeptide repeat protein [Desulfosporosinus sp. PR]